MNINWTMAKAEKFANTLDFEKQGGLVPAIAVRSGDGRVLMLAYMDRDALLKTLTSGSMWYYSRSRKRLWRKGEESGNTQRMLGVSKDCDSDSLLFEVKQKGPACHTGKESCFGNGPFTLSTLASVIEARKKRLGGKSYTRRLLSDKRLLSSKLYEEAAEVVEAFNEKPKKAVVWEAADLIYHLMVALSARGLGLEDVERELERRSR